MDSFSYFHICDHRIKRAIKDGEAATLFVNHGRDLIDIVINGGILLEIIDVRALEYDPKDVEIEDFYYDNEKRHQTYDDVDPEDSYYDDKEAFIIDYSKYYKGGQKVSEPLPESFYEPILHNRIRWMVKPPKLYQVKAKVRYTNQNYVTYASQDCPVCGGKGWFVDILNKDGEFTVPTGVVKIGQRVIKDLLTQLGTHPFDKEYGTTLKNDLMSATTDDEQLFDLVRLAVSEVEDQYLNDQQNIIGELPNEEILQSLITDNVYRLNNTTVIIAEIRIQTLEEEQVFQFGI